MSRDDATPPGSTTRIATRTGWASRVSLPAIEIKHLREGQTIDEWTRTETTLRVGTSAECEVRLQDPTVSRVHLEIENGSRGLLVRDMGSTNGTWIDGVRVFEAPLEPGRVLRAGACELAVAPARADLVAPPSEAPRHRELVGPSEAMRGLFSLIEAVAPTTATVLIQGESGTGKELIARALHEESGRKGRLVTFDCANTSPDLIRSELFGHRRGAFSGALEDRAGAFVAAAGGTLFIDEIGELPLALQPSFLRALESRRVQPVGLDVTVATDVRVIAATHRDLAALAAAGRFRMDLYHRLAVVLLEPPPLRQRLEDIPQLAAALIERSGSDKRLSPAALAALRDHPWTGNVRELRNVLERACVMTRSGILEPKDLRLSGAAPAVPPPSPGPDVTPVTPAPGAAPAASPGIRALADVEKSAILDAFERCERNQVRTSAALGISLNTLKRRLREYGL